MSGETEQPQRRARKSSVEGAAAAGASTSLVAAPRLTVIEKTPEAHRLGLIDVTTGEVLALPDTTVLPTVERAYTLITPLRMALANGRKYIGALTDMALRDLDSRGASERRINGVLYKKESDAEWQVDHALMRTALEALVPGELTAEEVEEAVVKNVTIDYKASNTVLNKLVKRGGIVAETIGKYRRRNEGAPRIVRVE